MMYIKCKFSDSFSYSTEMLLLILKEIGWGECPLQDIYDRVAIGGHIPCTRCPQTCHTWKLGMGLYDVQLGSDFNMLETLHVKVNH